MCSKWIAGLLLTVVLVPCSASALSIGEAIEVIALRLEQDQIKEGASEGIWPEEAEFTGPIATGMARAYQLTCEELYGTSAIRAGLRILWSSQGNFYGDEAFALTCLSEISFDPCDNIRRTALSDFYYHVAHDVNGIEGYLSQYIGTEPSTAVFYLAHHVVAAYYVDAEGKQMWRDSLVDWLAQVDDSSDFPVMALGAATWALAQTGPLDETLIDPARTGASYWNLRELVDLPGLLLSHHIPEGQPYTGSFYWRFDHGDGGFGDASSGYTEDTIFGTLGLIAAFEANPDLDFDAAILAGRQALLGGIEPDGKVYEHLWSRGRIYYAYAGEMLQVLGELVACGDLDLDGSVNFLDFAIFADSWRASGCTACDWCNGADLDHNGEVNFIDLGMLLDNCLGGVSHQVE